jgi:PAS domain S-box-containing protein
MATVLVVDDDAINREFLRTLLVHRGHEVCEAADGESALRLAGREPPDAVITDVLMPGMDGYELARLLRSLPATSHVPVAFSTAHYAQHEIAKLARACGVQDVIVKPAHPRAVLAALDSLLRTAPTALAPVATVEEFADEHRLALKSKLFQKAEALGLSEGRLRAIVQSTMAGVVLAHDDGTATYVNDRLAEITGRTGKSLLRLGWLGCVEESDRDRLLATVLQGIPAQGSELRVRAARGDERWLSVRLYPVREGCPERMVVVIEDATDTVRAQQRMAGLESREAVLRRDVGRLNDLLGETQRVTQAGMWDMDPQTGVIELSPGLRDLLRLSGGPVRSDLLWQRVHPDDLDRAKAMAHRTLRTGQPQVVELRVADLDGVVHSLVVSCRISAASHEDGLRSRTLWGVTQDVTEVAEERIRLQMGADWRAQRRMLDRMQLAMFPREIPEVTGVELAAAYIAARDRLDIGGDWYDFVPWQSGVVMVVGDVAGHEQAAPAVMGPVRAVLRGYALEDPDPARILARLNRFLLASYHDDTYVTALVAHYDPDTRRLTAANAGHPAPLLARFDRPEGVPRVVSFAEPGPALGILADAPFSTVQTILEPGTALCAYTDGLTDSPAYLGAAAQERLAETAATAYQRAMLEEPSVVPIAHRLVDDIARGMLPDASTRDDACLAVLRVPH